MAETTGMPKVTVEDQGLVEQPGAQSRWFGWLAQAVGPIALALLVGGFILLVIGRDPLGFYGDIVGRGLFHPSGVQETVNRMAPLLLIGCGLIIAFRAGIWNIGGDGQFIVAAVLVAGTGAPLVRALPNTVAFMILGAIGAAAGALWALVPAYLKARLGINEIITSLMMTLVGLNVAGMLIKGPFRCWLTAVPRTAQIPFEDFLPDLPGTRIHLGIVVTLVLVVVVHYVMTRTSFGLRLRVLGTNWRVASHAGLDNFGLTIVAFMLSGAFMGLAAAVEILGMWGHIRSGWNPGFGLPLFALVFLARLNAIAVIPLVGFYSVFSTAGAGAARRADLCIHFLLVIMGLTLLFMTFMEYVASWREQRAYLTRTLKPAPYRRMDEDRAVDL
jgi:simple sugar transport system permease protein